MNPSSSSSGWRFGFLGFFAGALTVFVLLGHMRTTAEMAVLRAERDRLGAELQQSRSRLEMIERKVEELAMNRREPPMDPRLPRMDRPGMEPGPPPPGGPRATNFRTRLGNVLRAQGLDATSLEAPTPPSMGKRSWGPEQAVGPPDTPNAGDQPTAWASQQQDAGSEWLKLDYERPVEIAEVRIHETYNPGAIRRVETTDNGRPQVLWEGTEEVHPAPYIFVVPVSGKVMARSIRVHLDSSAVPGWNEIDAVELVGRDGSRQWAQSASASSTFAEFALPPPPTLEPPDSVRPVPSPRTPQ